MKILHIGKFYPPFHGGMENYLRDLAQQQCHAGNEVTVWVHNHDWRGLVSKTTDENIEGVKVIRQKSLKPLLFTPIMLGFGKQLKHILAQQKPDIIHLHWPNPSLFKMLLNQSGKQVPWVISWHSDMVTKHSSKLMKLVYWLIKPLETMLIKHCKSILVSSQAYANHSPQLIKFNDKIKVIPLGLNTLEIDRLNLGTDSDDFQQADNQWLNGQLRLLHVGRLTFYKNQSFLIKTMSSITEAQLLIAGVGQLQHDLENQIIELQLQQQVKLIGSQSWRQLHALFKTCDVFCMASHDRAESFGVVLLEAMYHDKIILVPDTVGSGMAWLAENYNKGFLYQVNDCDDFIEKINHIRQNLDQILAKPKQFNYHMRQTAELIQTHYKKILTGENNE